MNQHSHINIFPLNNVRFYLQLRKNRNLIDFFFLIQKIYFLNRLGFLTSKKKK